MDTHRAAGPAAVPSSTTLAIDQIIRRLGAGDRSAREELIARAQARLELLARRRLRRFPEVCRWYETADVAQSATERLWRALNSVTINDARHFFALASQHIRWELLSLQERVARGGPLGRGHETRAEFDGSSRQGHPLDAVADDRPDPGRWLEQAEVFGSIEKLPGDLREVVDLYVVQDLPRAQVAALLGISQRHVNRLWIRARLLLAEMISKAP